MRYPELTLKLVLDLGAWGFCWVLSTDFQGRESWGSLTMDRKEIEQNRAEEGAPSKGWGGGGLAVTCFMAQTPLVIPPLGTCEGVGLHLRFPECGLHPVSGAVSGGTAPEKEHGSQSRDTHL